MVKLAELDADDKVFDPACGTARFLTHALADMTEKVKSSRDAATKIKHIKEYQMIGVDDGFTVAKLAKMNMYIHGDGKTNIQDADGLATTEQDNKIDVILTNPPLGDVSYYRTKYNDDFRLKRMEVIPRKNITKEKLKTIENKIVEQKLLLTTAHDDKTRKIRCRLEQLNQQKIELDLIGRSGRSEYVPVGQVMKGGALFSQCMQTLLKNYKRPFKTY